MGQGSAEHVEDELGLLASRVVARVRPNQSDREGKNDCYQAAFAAGLAACQAARRKGNRISSEMLFKCMRQAVYRLLRRRKELREADVRIVA